MLVIVAFGVAPVVGVKLKAVAATPDQLMLFC